MKNPITSDIKECSSSGLQIIYKALNVPSFRPLPENFHYIPNVNVYEAPGQKGGNWEQHLNDQGQAWIITPLHYTHCGSNAIRSASGGGRWVARDRKKKDVDVSWYERKYKLERTNEQQATKEGAGFQKCTMVEYLPDEKKPAHALCRITVHNENNASSQQREGKEIDHTDSNNGDKRHKKLKTSLSQESTQQGGNFQNTTADYNRQIDLKRKLREIRKEYSYPAILKVISDEMESENFVATFMGGLDEQEIEQNVQDPCNFNANLAEPTENISDLPFYCAPTVLESEPTETGNHFPIYNQQRIAPGLDTNNNATTEPEDMEWNNNIEDLSAWLLE